MSFSLEKIYQKWHITPDEWFVKPRSPKIGIKLIEVIPILIKEGPQGICSKFNCSKSTAYRKTNMRFPDKNKTIHWKTYFVEGLGLKFCSGCNEYLEKNDFNKDISTRDGLANKCRVCENIRAKVSYSISKEYNPAKAAKYRAAKINATPKWADINKISEFYLNCPQGYHVDHIVPLQGTNVSGLHVLENLQYLSATDNYSKSNKWNWNTQK